MTDSSTFLEVNEVTADTTADQLRKLTKQVRKKSKPPLKVDADFAASAKDLHTVAGQELRSFIERYERLEAEKKDISDGQKEIMAEAKGRGYDTKVIRKLINIRKRDANDLAEEDAIMQMYMTALEM